MKFTIIKYNPSKQFFELVGDYSHNHYGVVPVRIIVYVNDFFAEVISLNLGEKVLPKEEYVRLMDEIKENTLLLEAAEFIKEYCDELEQTIHIDDVFILTADTRYIRNVSRSVADSFVPEETQTEEHLIRVYIMTGEKEGGYLARLKYKKSKYTLSLGKKDKKELKEFFNQKGFEWILLQKTLRLVKGKVNFVLPD